MWVFLSKRLRRFLLVSVAIPLAPRAIRAIRLQVERRTGPTRATHWFGQAETLAHSLETRIPRRTRRRGGTAH